MPTLLTKLDNLFKDKRIIFYLFLFLLVFSFFLYLNATPSFADPDSFYHAKISSFLSQGKLIQDFSWLPFSALGQNYADHHFLYHLILAPAVGFFNALIVIKLSAVLFAALFILLFQLILDKLHIRYSFLYTLLLFFSPLFIFRINLAKAPSLSLIFLLIAIYLILHLSSRAKKTSLFIISFLYVWLYGGWIILVGMAVIYYLTSAIYRWCQLIKGKNSSYLRSLAQQLKSKTNFQTLFIVFMGSLSGLILNPYFPQNLYFYKQQIFEIALFNYKHIISVGTEWQSYHLFDLIADNVYIFLVLFVALFIFFYNFNKYNEQHLFLLSIVCVFFYLTLKSIRNLEYFIPLSVIFSAIIINEYSAHWHKDKSNLINFYKKYKKAAVIIVILLLIYLPMATTLSIFGIKDKLDGNFYFNKYKATSSYLKNNSQGGTIFHDSWSDWPLLFYHNHFNNYIIGLDPTFNYLFSEQKYWLWHNISNGRTKSRVCQKINSNFRASYIIVNNSNTDFIKNLKADKNCQLVFRGEYAEIYKIDLN